MKIRKISIKNFRGIKSLDWSLPSGNIFCLIGKGDSSKSTILDCIQYAFYPQWNLSLNDSDFHLCNINTPITIEISIGELIDEFCSLKKYGNYLRGWDPKTQTISEEPADDLESIITIRLTIEKDLEPKWIVVCASNPEGIEFKTNDRIKAGVGIIGSYTEKHLSWANGTALTKLTETQNLSESLAHASRTARSSLNDSRAKTLKSFDDAAKKSQEVAKLLGVPVNETYQAHLDLNSINIRIGGLTLHDGEMPLRQLGLGSRRMLLCGIQKEALQDGHITLFDEVEFGLEPHRIARLIKHVKGDLSGQYVLTTHSPTVVRELAAKDIFVVHNKAGIVEVIAATDKKLEDYEIQGKLRSSAEAFLAKKVLICEGATENGFLRGLDDYQLSKGKDPFSYHGVALLDAEGGGKVKELAKAFHSLNYDVAVLADADAEDQFSQKDILELSNLGIKVQVWNDKLCIEGRAMQDLPWTSIIASLILARDDFNISVYDQVNAKFEDKLDNDLTKWIDSQELRQVIAAVAKKKGWFKNITNGDLWFKTIVPAFNDANFLKSDLAVKLSQLWTWAENV